MKVKKIEVEIKTDNDELSLQPISAEETKLNKWFYCKKLEKIKDVDLAKLFDVSPVIISHWRDGVYSEKYISKISEVTLIPEWDLILDLFALRKYIKIYA